MGWVAALHRHHDHSEGYFRQKAGRFPETVICSSCNSADGAAKRQLKLPKNFSFSPGEIGTFVIATPHEGHAVDLDAAHLTYILIE